MSDSKPQVTVKSLRAFRLKGGHEVLSSTPIVVPVPIPSLAAQVHEVTRLGNARYAAYYDDDGTWQDHKEGVPPEGYSPHEIAGNPVLSAAYKKLAEGLGQNPPNKPEKNPPSGEKKQTASKEQSDDPAEQLTTTKTTKTDPSQAGKK